MGYPSYPFKQVIKDNIPALQAVGYFPRRMDKVMTPALFIDLVELENDTDPGTEELALITHWEARLVVADGLPDSVKTLRSLCIAVMQVLFIKRLEIPNVGAAKLKQAQPDHFTPELVGYLTWLIEWTCPIRVGESVWKVEGSVPTEVYLGYAPEIGENNRSRYMGLSD